MKLTWQAYLVSSVHPKLVSPSEAKNGDWLSNLIKVWARQINKLFITEESVILLRTILILVLEYQNNCK